MSNPEELTRQSIDINAAMELGRQERSRAFHEGLRWIVAFIRARTAPATRQAGQPC